MIGPAGRQEGIGVLYDQVNGTRTYMDIRTFDFGVGVGATDTQFLLVLDSKEAIEGVRDGLWNLGMDTGATLGQSSIVSEQIESGMTAYRRSESGAAASASLRLRRIRVNEDLTDVGASDFSMPNIGNSSQYGQGESAPRLWTHALPFLAQNVIDLGYDLPQPYGFGATYVDLTQDMRLENIEVGFNGSPKVPFAFVSFDNAITDTQSTQFKADVWVLPFMNVFVNFGRSTGGLEMDVLLDGNLILEQIGDDCMPPSVACRRLRDETILLPIKTNLNVRNYGAGMVFAAGWNGWFTALPMNVSWAQRDNTEIDGFSFTFTPRVGRLINLGNYGNAAFFVGGNYLDSESEIDGVLIIPDLDLSLEYLLDQANSDRWNAVVGMNWDVNKHMSVLVEYNGFVGSREATTVSLNWRL